MYVKTVLGANTFTLSDTAGGTAFDTSAGSQSGTHTGHTFATRAGNSGSVAMVVHGTVSGLIIENNRIQEDTTPTSGASWCMSVDSAAYSSPYGSRAEGFYNVVIRGNTCNNYQLGIGADIVQRGLMENNSVYTATAGDKACGRMRSKVFTTAATYSGTATAGASTTLTDSGKSFSGLTTSSRVKITGGTGAGQLRTLASNTGTVLTVSAAWDTIPDTSSTYVVSAASAIDADDQQPDKFTMRNNSCYMASPNLNSEGWGIAGSVADELNGATYSMDSNSVHFGTGSTAATMCFNTSNITAAKFTSRNYNHCHYVGTAGLWDSQYGNLASTQAQGFDLNSISTLPVYAATPAVGNNWSLAPDTTSPLKNTGHPTRSSRLAIGNKLRSQADATPDIGAHEFGATTALPSAPTRVSVQ
jgi:hypothetical protein